MEPIVNEVCDLVSERGLLGAIFQFGGAAYHDVSDIVSAEGFVDETNQMLFRCFESIFKENPDAKPDIPTILSVANNLGFGRFFERSSERQHIRAVLATVVRAENARKFAQIIRKLQIRREAIQIARGVKKSLEEADNGLSVDGILALLEKPIFDFSASINGVGGSDVQSMGGDVEEYLDHIESNPRETLGISTGFKYFDEAIGGGLRRKTVNLVGSRVKTGKAQSLDSFVMTPYGPKRMGDIQVGDYVSTPNGHRAIVKAIHPQGKKPMYRVTFADGDSVECCEDHLWKVRHYKFHEFHVRSLRDIMTWGTNYRTKSVWAVEVPKFCFFAKRTVPTDPYLLGLLIGVGKNSHTKFIPYEYKYNSEEVRLAVLQGLMDMDGCVDESGQIEYSTTSFRLASDVIFLVKSLGGLATVSPRITSCNGKQFRSFRIHIIFDRPEIFRLTRKRIRLKNRVKGNLCRWIKSIEPIGEKEAQCITVDSQDGLYLTDNFVVTHNSFYGDNVSLFVASKLSIPVLNLDTEMDREQHQSRLLACLSAVKTKEIETGKFAEDPQKRQKVRRAATYLKTLPYDYISVAGRPFEEILSICRRWIMKRVGFNDNGTTKDCLIVYDYMKMMSADGISHSMQEYQMLGFMMTSLVNFCIQYDVPCLSFIQLNRDGISKESQEVVSGSDRQLWTCANFSIFKEKTEDDIAQEGLKNGNRKLVPIVCRHGAGLPGDHINFQLDGDIGRLTELGLRSEMSRKNLEPEIDEEDDVFANE